LILAAAVIVTSIVFATIGIFIAEFIIAVMANFVTAPARATKEPARPLNPYGARDPIAYRGVAILSGKLLAPDIHIWLCRALLIPGINLAPQRQNWIRVL
jgi:hypothetical protein